MKIVLQLGVHQLIASLLETAVTVAKERQTLKSAT